MGKKIRNSRKRALDRLDNNPYGANQWIADPRQQRFLAFYKDPKSPTFSNAKQSAIRAGFTEDYADNILALQPTWLSDAIGGVSPLLARAERNLQEFLELPNETQAMSMYGPIFETIKTKVPDGEYKNGKPKFKVVKEKKPVMRLDPKIMKIKQDSSHFIASTVGKKKYGTKASEGGNTYNVMIFANEQRNRIAKRIIGGGSVSDQPSEAVAN